MWFNLKRGGRLNSKNITKEKLLLTAKTILNQEGLKKLSMKNIAEKAHVSVGSIYKYFPTKTDILIEIALIYWNKIIEELENAKIDSFENAVEFEYKLFKQDNSLTSGLVNHNKLFTISNLDKANKTMNDYQIKFKDFIKDSIINDKNLKNTDDLEFISQITDLVFETVILDVSKNTTSYKILILIIKKYFY